jgi:hypothetical protein
MSKIKELVTQQEMLKNEQLDALYWEGKSVELINNKTVA